MLLQVEGMSCGHCVAAVTEAIQALDSAAQVKVDLANGQVTVKSQQLTEMQVITAIAEQGYSVGLA